MGRIGTRLPFTAMIRRLLSVDRSSLLLAGFNLVAGIVITTLLVIAISDAPYPPGVGLALALFVGGGLTCITVWVSLAFAGGEQPEEPAGGRGSGGKRKS